MERGQDEGEVKGKIDLVGGEEGYAELCAGCEGSERDGTMPFRSPCCTV